MGELPFFLILIVAGLIQVGILTIIILGLYRIVTRKQTSRTQATSVGVALIIVDGSIGAATYTQSDTTVPTWWIGLYILTVFCVGFVAAYCSRSRAE